MTAAFLYCGGYRFRISAMSFSFSGLNLNGMLAWLSGVSRWTANAWLPRDDDGGDDAAALTTGVAVRGRTVRAAAPQAAASRSDTDRAAIVKYYIESAKGSREADAEDPAEDGTGWGVEVGVEVVARFGLV